MAKVAKPDLNMDTILSIQGEDNRVPVVERKRFPFSAICSLWVTSAAGTHRVGTGFRVAPRIVVTAGHVLLPRDGEGAQALSIEVGIGGDSADPSVVRYTTEDYRVMAAWHSSRQSDADMGIVILPPEAGITTAECFGLPTHFPGCHELERRRLTIAGFSLNGDDTYSGHYLRGLGHVTMATGTALYYSIDTYGGQSGAPIWCGDDSHPLLVGMHVEGNTQAPGSSIQVNRGIQFTPELIALIQSNIARLA